MSHRPLFSLLAALCLICSNASAQSPKTSRYFEDALKRYASKDLEGAAVQVRNALQEDRKFLPAHLLLGKVSLESGNPGAAEAALQEALALGASRTEVVLPLGKAMMALGQQLKLVDDPALRLEGLPNDVLAQLILIHAAARIDLGDERKALALIEQARGLAPGDPQVWLAEVPLHLRAQAFDAAQRASERALQLKPNDSDALYSLASVFHAKGQLDAALSHYDRALAQAPEHLEALVARAGIALDRKNLGRARADIDLARKKSPKDPRADYLSALISEAEGNRAASLAAMRRVTELLGSAPAEFLRFRPQVLMLGGLAHYALNEPGKARPYLESVVKLQPRNPSAKLLAQILMREGEVENGVQMLETYLRQVPQDFQAAALLASAHSTQGRHTKAVQLMEQALRSKDSAELHSVLGLSMLRMGKIDTAQQELERAWKSQPGHTATGVSLTMLYLRSKQLTKALPVAKSLVQAQPQQASLHHLLGMVLAAQSDAAGARSSFERALKLDPKLHEATMSLARLEARTGNPAAALSRLEALHRTEEKLVEPLLELASLQMRLDRIDQAERWLERAITVAAPKDLRPGLALIDLRLKRNDAAKAMEAAKALLAKGPDDPLALMAYARTLMANGQMSAAKTYLVQTGRHLPFNADAYAEIAGLQIQVGDLAGAVFTLSKVLEQQPKHADALTLMASAEIDRGGITEAAKYLSTLMEVRPKQARTHLLAAELSMAKRLPEQALASLRKAHELQPSTATVMRLMLHPGAAAQASSRQLAESWLRSRPKDHTVRLALAESLAAQGQLAPSRSHYEQLLQARPNDAQLLNNLAQVRLRQSEVSEALQLAEKAVKAAPQMPLVLDTYAWILHHKGENEKALGLLRDARLRAPDHAEIRFHLAAVLHKLGRSAEAKTEVSAALAAPAGLESVKEAQALMQALK
ncbi:putative PEP-CTERM system TPR-repeat lipoprotein [Inhella inkyongensis]|uniref:Putative PEP-CTERM system TPR-repeat lipoprotein n=1 Tax=Inhella inkyongensis TaxID=392593 RepID=A0A840S943_9BURK|nr:XrtA/PEP-CTERM system TPR-repeat protein PrsT [Inhella inkyongensis]MBB5206163.1 putative PEP-CTERM system TPR-repeat lipoprotein [Inhella inkyongensis]